LAGISTTPRIDENTFDIRATNKLNKLYVELLRHNPDWGTDARRQDLNHFFARLIFCFFAEDTNIFTGRRLFTDTVEKYTDRTGANVHEILAEVFRAMDTRREDRAGGGSGADLRPFALKFHYVNGNLFGGNTDTPRFTQAARIYLVAVGSLDWKQINPDIFGSMIQAVADDEERGALGMHYTSVPNILKVLNPLFLDELRAKLEEAGDGKTPGSARKLLNLRNRLARIRVFDPACGSGNFLVIAYKEMRQIEAQINQLRGEPDLKSAIPISNFRGIELRSFPAEIARLALIIAEFQCDVLYRGQLIAEHDFLPLKRENWIVCGNALRLDWLTVCPPTGTGVKIESDGLFREKLDQVEIDFENAGGETYLCGNPPYKGSKWQTPEQKADLKQAWSKVPRLAKTTDYVSGWIARYLDYAASVPDAVAAFVATNSLCQGQQATDIWPAVFRAGLELRFAHVPFKWSNLASHNAGVTVIIVGIGKKSSITKRLFDGGTIRECSVIGPYLVPNKSEIVMKLNEPISQLSKMLFGNMPRDGGNLFLSWNEAAELRHDESVHNFVRRFVGSEELINGKLRYCLWIEDGDVGEAKGNPFVAARLALVASNRLESDAESTRQFAAKPHRFVQIGGVAQHAQILVPGVSSENRDYLPCDYLPAGSIASNKCFGLYDAPLWNLAIVASRLHWVWIGTVCVRLEMRFSYSNTLGWNTFPVPTLTDQNKADLTRCAEDILLAREAHFPATIADLYDPEAMDTKYPDLRAAHERNDETLERIYIGRRFRNDTERLEKLFEMYTEMTGKQAGAKATKGVRSARRKPLTS
jgi:hypothetical protein